jgi:hypothetical protein
LDAFGMKIEIVDATAEHVRILARTMRDEDRAEISGMNCHVRHTLHDLYRTSLNSRTALVDGVVAAVWGLQGGLLDDVGYPWLFTAPAAERAPVAFVKTAGRELAGMLATHRILLTRVMASYERSIRLFERLGFRIGPVVTESSGIGYRQMVLERDRAPPSGPFVVFGLPRSRTAWLARFLSYDGWAVHHDLPIAMGSVREMLDALRQPETGTVETGLTRGARTILDAFPAVRIVVVRRSVDDVRASAARLGWGYANGYLEGEAARLEEIAALPGALVVDYADLAKERVCRRVFEHCLGRPFDQAWWRALAGRNIQVGVEHEALLEQRRPAIAAFFDDLDRYVTIQHEPFETFYRDAAALFPLHALEAGGFAGLTLDPDADMARALEREGNLLITTARNASGVVGYLMFMINPCFESRGVRLGFQNIFFVRRDYRGGLGRISVGGRMHAAARAGLKARGVTAMVGRAGVRADGAKQKHLYDRLGAHAMGSLHFLRLD